MAMGAVGTQLAGMPIFMAGGALATQAEEGFIDILQLNFETGRSRYLLRGMAAFAFLFAMPAFEGKAGVPRMVEGLTIEACKGKIPAVMFHMALGTIALPGRSFDGSRMEAGL